MRQMRLISSAPAPPLERRWRDQLGARHKWHAGWHHTTWDHAARMQQKPFMQHQPDQSKFSAFTHHPNGPATQPPSTQHFPKSLANAPGAKMRIALASSSPPPPRRLPLPPSCCCCCRWPRVATTWATRASIKSVFTRLSSTFDSEMRVCSLYCPAPPPSCSPAAAAPLPSPPSPPPPELSLPCLLPPPERLAHFEDFPISRPVASRASSRKRSASSLIRQQRILPACGNQAGSSRARQSAGQKHRGAVCIY